MNLRLMLRKKRVWIPLVLFVAYALFGFFVLPGILRDQIVQGIRANLGREARLERVRVNPLIFSLTLEGFELRDPDHSSFVAFKRLYMDLQATSLVRWAIAFRAFRLDGLRLNVRVMPDGKLNFQDMIKDEGKPPRIVIGRFQISDGSVSMANLMSPKPEEATLAPIDLRLDNFTTIPQKEGHYRITATDPGRGIWQWTGDLTFEPLVSSGVLEISGSRLRSWWQIVRHRVGLEVADGTLGCRLAYSASVVGDSVVARVDDSSLAITGFAVREPGREQDLLKLDTLAVTGVNVRYPEQSVAVGRVLVAGTRVRAWLDPDTTLNWQRLLAAAPPSAMAPRAQTTGAAPDSVPAGSPASAPAWLLTLGELAVRDLGVDFQDSTIAPPLAFSVVPVNVTVRDISSRPGAKMALAADATIAGTGRLDLSSTVAAQPLSADVELRLKDLPLPIFQPYLSRVAKLRLASGTLGVTGAIQVREGASMPAVAFQGELESRKLMTRDRRDNEPFLGWKALEVSGIDVAPTHVRIGTVKLTEPFSKLLIKRDRTTNIQEIFGLPTLDSTGTPIEPQSVSSAGTGNVAKAAPAKKGKAGKNAKANQPKTSETLEAMRTSAETLMPVQISKIEVVRGTADFADLSLILPFVARIEQLGGSVTRISSTSAHRAAVRLDGQLRPSGTVHVGGDLNPWAPDTVLDLRVVFNDFNMPALTPYAGQFLGREIDKGRMSLDLGYRLHGRHLVGENKVVLDQLELGQKVHSPEATKMPVGLAIAILKDRNGKIDLDVPVEGDVDDPKFRIGKIIWDFIMSLLGKVATAPFALLGRLIGGGSSDELGQVAFDPGVSTLAPDQQESVDKLAKALVERPQLSIELRGSSNDTLDAAAIRKAKFAAQAGEKMAAHPKRYGTGVGYSPRLLEELFVERLGKKSLSELEDRFKVAAGELEPGSPQYKAGSKRLVVNEAALYAAIQDTLTALQSADPGELLSLANARAGVIKTRLVEQGIEERRVYLLDPAPGAIEGGRVRMDIALTD